MEIIFNQIFENKDPLNFVLKKEGVGFLVNQTNFIYV